MRYISRGIMRKYIAELVKNPVNIKFQLQFSRHPTLQLLSVFDVTTRISSSILSISDTRHYNMLYYTISVTKILETKKKKILVQTHRKRKIPSYPSIQSFDEYTILEYLLRTTKHRSAHIYTTRVCNIRIRIHRPTENEYMSPTHCARDRFRALFFPVSPMDFWRLFFFITCIHCVYCALFSNFHYRESGVRIYRILQ